MMGYGRKKKSTWTSCDDRGDALKHNKGKAEECSEIHNISRNGMLQDARKNIKINLFPLLIVEILEENAFAIQPGQ